MVDTFEPLFVTRDAESSIDENYPFSWLKKDK